ncbi:MAG: hypothetical protein NZ551_02890 [Microscillaceae bacterium]|nr:hypothetical protein [Microscillaceae bacterium]MDW8460134.1 hypothetical protein [Cytophagales bacterium]
MKIRLKNIKTPKIENIFPVPTGYFEALPQKIANRIKESNADNKLESNAHLKQNVFFVPQSYFIELFRRISQKIRNLDIENNPHLRQNVWQVPDNYFETLSQRINQRIESQADTKGKVILLHSPTFYLKATAVAASIVLLWVGVWMFNFNKTTIVQKVTFKQKNIPTAEQKMAHTVSQQAHTHQQPMPKIPTHTPITKGALVFKEQTPLITIDSLNKQEILHYLAQETNYHNLLLEEIHTESWENETILAEIANSELDRLLELDEQEYE